MEIWPEKGEPMVTVLQIVPAKDIIVLHDAFIYYGFIYVTPDTLLVPVKFQRVLGHSDPYSRNMQH